MTPRAEAVRARGELNGLLRDDDRTGLLHVEPGARTLSFPGHSTPLAQAVAIHEVWRTD